MLFAGVRVHCDFPQLTAMHNQEHVKSRDGSFIAAVSCGLLMGRACTGKGVRGVRSPVSNSPLDGCAGLPEGSRANTMFRRAGGSKTLRWPTNLIAGVAA